MTALASYLLYLAGAFLLIRVLLSLKSIVFLLGRCWRWLDDRTQFYQLYRIPRFTADGFHENALYRKASHYVSALPSLEDSGDISLFSSGRKPNDFVLQLRSGQEAYDYYLGARLSWAIDSAPEPCLLLKLRRQDRRRVLRPYLQHVEALADEIELRKRETRLWTHSIDVSDGEPRWRSVPFTHPATFETVATDPEVKNKMRSDLEAFIKGRTYYHRLGRVWRRSYLLHGAPGTGKSSFVAAMARFLCYDVYDFDLSRIADASELRALLLRTTPRSVILMEDLDRYLASIPEEKLAGLMNFMDGIFNCCGEERVMVVTMTTAGRDAADAAVIRPGRADVQVHFPMCDFGAFKTMASSYLGIREHKLYPQVEEGFHAGARLSPAEVGEIMIANRGSPSRAIKSVINALQQSSAGSSGRFPGRRLSEASSENGREPTSAELICGGGSGGLGFGKDATMREIKKLYGLIRRSTSKREGVMTVEAAAAAAAAASAAANAGEKEG